MAGPKAALYLRLSREDEDRLNESESIRNQREFLLQYAEAQGYEVAGVYVDDGYTGTNFDRPDFQRMIRDIEAGEIAIVITKDLSRLGRDYIQTGHLLERYFPGKNIRYIAVNDGVDTFKAVAGNDMTAFRAVFNDMYAKDISTKVRSALLTKKKQGQFVGSVAPYGYRKDPQNKNRLLIDEENAPVVKRIFEMYLAGETVLGIAKRLTEMQVPTPSQSKGVAATQKRFTGVWNDQTVKRILKNQTYAGHLTQNRVKKINYKIKKKVALPPGEWIIVPDTHEAIIGQTDFDAVQHMLHVKTYRKEKRTGAVHLLTGIAFCADCLSPMSTVRESGKRNYLVCSNWRKYARLHLCQSHCIREDLVVREIAGQLRSLAEKYISKAQLAEDAAMGSENGLEHKMLSGLEKKLERVKAAKLSLYKDRASGVLRDKEYVDFAGALQKEADELETQIEMVQANTQQRQESHDIGHLIEEVLGFEALTRETLLMLVSKVLIGKDKVITIQFSFSSPE